MINSTIEIEELPSSKLGTREYWDDFYKNELQNFSENQDEGEIWFGHTHMMRVVRWILKSTEITCESTVLDMGCGNGVFLFELADEDFIHLYGIDYSHTGIQLAKNIAQEKDKKIIFKQCDLLDPSSLTTIGLTLQFDVCHDKGTYDAISLMPDNSKIARQQYITTLKNMLKDKGLFIITSCNWTLDELKIHFSNGFEYVDHIPAPTYQYGGQSGSTVSSAVFRLIKPS